MKAIKILGVSLLIITLNVQFSLAQLGSEEAAIIERVQTSIQNLVDQTEIRGATATYYWGDEFTTIAAGEKKPGVSVDGDGKFMFRSFTKLLISTIILQLQEEAVLSIDDEIGQFLNPINNVDASITIRELLSMRASVCNFISPSWTFLSEVNPDSVLDPEAVLNELIPDGSCNSNHSYDYNDTNFQLLGLIIEAATGNTGETEFEHRLFSHLGEHSLALAPIDLREEELNGTWSINSSGTIIDVGSVSKNSVLSAHKYSSGLVGTTKDALRLLMKILDGEIITEESLALMKDIDSDGYGLGLMNRFLDGDEVFGHGGSGLHRSRTFYNPEQKIGISLALNYSINQQNNAEQILLNNYLELKTCRENGGCKIKVEEYEELVGELQQILDDKIPNYGIEGVATTIVFPNEEVHTIASGYGQTVDDPVDPTKKWHWASGTKPMTGYIILKLAELGLIDITDTVGEYLDLNSIPNVSSDITIKNLLQHTGGLEEVWSESNNSLWNAVWGDRDRVWNPNEFKQYIPEAHSAPGEHYYNSTNSYLLSFIIQEVTGKSLEANFQKYIFEPLGMTSSYLSSGKDIDMSQFNGAWLGSDNRSNISHTSYLSSRSGNSAHIATSEDAVKFYRSYYSGELLPEDLMDEVKEPAAGSSDLIFENYACISKVTQLHGFETTMFEVIDTDGHTWNLYGHGGNGIHNSFTYHWKQKDLTIAMVINDFQVLEPSPFAALIFDVLCMIDAELDDVEIQPEATPGKLVERTFTHDEGTREYSIYLPMNYDSSLTYPLILNFHGYTGDIQDHIDRTKMHGLADSLGYLIAYPVGLTITRDPNILPSFVPASGAGWSVPGFSNEKDEIQFMLSLLADIESQNSIDEYRIHTTGLSLGGYMAAYIATQMPDRIASFASVAGHMTNEVFELLGDETQKSGLLIHGTQDIITNFQGLTNEYQSVEAVANKLAMNNNCNVQTDSTEIEDIDSTDNTTVTLFVYSDCDVISETRLNVKLYRVNEGGHRWPGSGRTEPAGLGFNSKDVSSSELIFEFFIENPYGGIIDSKEEFSDPITFTLSQNYPNPFNPSTNISFELPEAVLVQLKVYNLLGQEVAKLVDGRMNSGNHTIIYDASQLSSGVYIYRLIAGNQSITKKMTLIK